MYNFMFPREPADDRLGRRPAGASCSQRSKRRPACIALLNDVDDTVPHVTPLMRFARRILVLLSLARRSGG
jgi:hypothetical protein